MKFSRFASATFCLALLPLLSVAPLSASAAPGARHGSGGGSDAVTVLDWQLISLRTVYAESSPPTPIPVGTLYLGFTSLAIHGAVQEAKHGHASVGAAAAQAAHDVLGEYFPASAANLAADLAATLAAIPDSSMETRGVAIGKLVAAQMIESREDDGRNDTSIVYSRPAAPGVWQPPATGMLAPWLGFTDPLVLRHAVKVNGPDPLRSWAYARDLKEVQRDGSSTQTDDHKVAVATFFWFNSVVAYENALAVYLRGHPLSAPRTAELFAVINASMADAIRNVWRLKYDVGFWRPFQAIPAADTDGNSWTTADPAWLPLIARPLVPPPTPLVTPPYPEYPSGHAAVTGTFAESVRLFLGDDVPLVLESVSPLYDIDRSYGHLSDLEYDAFHARIWSGIHFRDAMEDGYALAHKTVRHVAWSLD
jgi:hypothetical protein